MSSINLGKRRTLKTMTAASAAGLLPTITGVVGTSLSTTASASVETPLDMSLELISSPDVAEDTLLLRNNTSNDISVTRFHAHRLVFDGGIVDCNNACASGAIRVPAGREVAVQVSSRISNNLGSPAGEYLDVHSGVNRLPNGTRLIPLGAHMKGSSAVLVAA